MRRPALIFDFGNVIAFFDYARACNPLAERLGISGDALLGRVREGGLAPILQRYESGRMTAREFSRAVCDLAGLDVEHDEFAGAWADIFWLNEPVARLVAQLKEAGYTLVLGSNTNDLHATHFRKQFERALAPFDRLVLSYEAGCIKPAAEFFHACAAAAGAALPECIFIDDLPENVEGARAAGMTGLVYRDPQSLRADLKAHGVEIADS